MTPRERWLAVLNRESFDRVPLDYRATSEVSKALVKHMGCGSLAQALDILHVDPVVTVGPRYVGRDLPADSNVFGVGYVNMDYGTGVYREPVYHPLAEYETVAEIERDYQWPSPNWYDYSRIPAQVKGNEDCVIRGGHYEEFATYKDLRGVQRAYLDLIEKPDMVHHCMQKLTDLTYENCYRIYEQVPGKVIWTWVAEDFGTQEGLIMSLEHIRDLFLPHMKRMIDLVHEAGAYVFHHSDGAVRYNVPQMIEAGIDVLDPVQWRCKGMDREGLKRDFGDAVVFHGAMDNQQTLAFGSVEEVRQEVEDNIRILGEGGGYMLGPCHNIQPVSPPENVVATYEAGYEHGWM